MGDVDSMSHKIIRDLDDMMVLKIPANNYKLNTTLRNWFAVLCKRIEKVALQTNSLFIGQS